MSCPEFSGGNGLHKPTKHLNLSIAQLKEKNSQWYVGILSQQRFPPTIQATGIGISDRKYSDFPCLIDTLR